MFPFTPHTTPRLDFGLGGFLFIGSKMTWKNQLAWDLPVMKLS